MADLDDFFAKKDRKKSKSKKVVATEEVAKKSDDTTSKKSVETKVRPDVDNNAPIAEQQVNIFLDSKSLFIVPNKINVKMSRSTILRFFCVVMCA